MSWKAEVRDVGGCGVGMSVKVCPSLTSAIRYVAGTLANPWAGSWTITGPAGTTITDGLTGGPVMSGPDPDPDHDEDPDETSEVLHLPHAGGVAGPAPGTRSDED